MNLLDGTVPLTDGKIDGDYCIWSLKWWITMRLLPFKLEHDAVILAEKLPVELMVHAKLDLRS